MAEASEGQAVPEETPKKKRQTKSWKTEAQQYEAWLVAVLGALEKVELDEGEALLDLPPGLRRWYDERQRALQANAEAARERALGKLTAEERAALGLP